MTVFVTHEPVRYDREQRKMVPINLNRARPYGKLRVIFPGANRPPPIDEAAPELKRVMAEFRPSDRLLIVGDMDLLAFAAVLAAKACDGQLTLLKWDGRLQDYLEVKAPCGLLS
jgi:hypothetical protein